MRNLWLCVIMFLGLAIASNAAIVGPYQPDAYTLQLWHLDETALPCLNSISGGPNMNDVGTPAMAGTASFAGFGNALNNGGGWLAPFAAANGTADNVTMSYAGSNGAFTYEAIIRIDFDPSAVQTAASMEIFSGDGEDPERLFQFRILTYTATHTKNELQFQRLPGTIAAVAADIPAAGDDAIAQNSWYHVAVSCDNSGSVRLYWTKMDAARTQANLIGSGTVTVLPAGITPDFCIGNEARDTNGRTEGFLGLIDEVRLSSVARPATGMMFAAVANPRASNPVPACFAANIPAAQTLQWTKGAYGNTAQYFYLTDRLIPNTTDPNFKGAAAVNVTGLSQYSPALAVDKNYHWAISNVMVDPNGMTDAVVWKFATEITVPIITTQPTDMMVDENQTAVFTLVVSSPTSVTYAWYKTLDNANNTPADDTLVGGNSSALTLNNVSQANDGYYYCKVTNGSSSPGNPAYSAAASLIVKRKIAHWTLDGSANDSAGGGLHGTLVGEPNFVSGKKGQALLFDGIDDYMQLPGGFSNFTSGLTYAVWAKPSAVTKHARFLDIGTAGPGDNIILMRDNLTNDLTLQVYKGTTLSGTVRATNVLSLDEWQMFVVTVDTAGSAAIYKNGIRVQTGTVSIPSIVTRTLNYIGQSNWTPADALYKGLMDDIQLYNYAKTYQNIVDMYNAETDPDIYVCITPQAYDINGDCKVNLDDVKQLALVWMQCGWYPASQCP